MFGWIKSLWTKISSVNWIHFLRIAMVVFCFLITLQTFFYVMFFMGINQTEYGYLWLTNGIIALILAFVLYEMGK